MRTSEEGRRVFAETSGVRLKASQAPVPFPPGSRPFGVFPVCVPAPGPEHLTPCPTPRPKDTAVWPAASDCPTNSQQYLVTFLLPQSLSPLPAEGGSSEEAVPRMHQRTF